MNLPLKISIGVATLGSLGGGVYLINQQLSTDNILKKLEKEGYSKLNNQSSDWDEILKSYKETVADVKNSDLKFDNLIGTEGKNKLQEKCEDAFNKASSNDSYYKKAKKWCTSPKKLTEILKNSGYGLLSNDSTKDENQTEWDTKLTAYDVNQEAQKKFGSLDLKKSGSLTKDAETRNKLKAECKKLDDKKHYEKDFELELKKSELWCAIKNTQ